MIVFRQDHSLQLQYDQMIQSALDGWTMGAAYGVQDNECLFQLENGQVWFYDFVKHSFAKCELTPAQKIAFDQKDILLWNGDSDQAKLSQFLLLLIRRARQIMPYADRHMTTVLQGKLNKMLLVYDLELQLRDEDSVVPTLVSGEQVVTLEEAFEKIIRKDKDLLTPVIQYVQVPVAEESTPVKKKKTKKKTARKEAEVAAVSKEAEEKPKAPAEVKEVDETLKNTAKTKVDTAATVEMTEVKAETPATDKPVVKTVDTPVTTPPETKEEKQKESIFPEDITEGEKEGFLKAKQLFDSIVGKAKPGTEVYHSVCFTMGEIMYYRDELKNAAYFYKLCELDRIKDVNDFYERLGHCYLDNKMNDFAPALKLQYRAEHNEDYKNSHLDELAASTKFSEKEIVEYRNTCIRVGRDKYAARS